MFDNPNRRRERRFYLRRPHKVIILDQSSRRALEGLLLNVSQSGMCVALGQRLSEDAEPFLKISGQRIGLRSIWDMAGLHGDALNRYGFQCRERRVNLLTEFKNAGLQPSQLYEKAQTDEEVFAALLEASLDDRSAMSAHAVS